MFQSIQNSSLRGAAGALFFFNSCFSSLGIFFFKEKSVFLQIGCMGGVLRTAFIKNNARTNIKSIIYEHFL